MNSISSIIRRSRACRAAPSLLSPLHRTLTTTITSPRQQDTPPPPNIQLLITKLKKSTEDACDYALIGNKDKFVAGVAQITQQLFFLHSQLNNYPSYSKNGTQDFTIFSSSPPNRSRKHGNSVYNKTVKNIRESSLEQGAVPASVYEYDVKKGRCGGDGGGGMVKIKDTFTHGVGRNEIHKEVVEAADTLPGTVSHGVSMGPESTFNEHALKGAVKEEGGGEEEVVEGRDDASKGYM